MIYEEAVGHVAGLCSDAEGFSRLLKSGLNEHLFIGVAPEERELFVFTRDWYLRDGTVPPRDILVGEFKQFFETREVPEELDVQPEYIVSFLKNHSVKAKVQGILSDAVKRLTDSEANQVEELAATHRDLSGLYMTVSGSHHVLEMSEAAPEVVRSIFDRAEDQQAYQDSLVKFPYDILDTTYHGGMRPRELAVFFGYTGDMKSFTVEHGSLKNALDGKRVAHFTFENGIEQTTTRMLAMLSGVPMGHLFEGTLPPVERDKLKEARETLASLPILLDESPGTDDRSVEAVFTKARSFEADLVIIDQANWIVSSDAKYKELWANLQTVVRKIQEHTNELGVVTFLAAQANRESQKTKKGTGLAHIAGTDEITKTASYAISLDYDETTQLLLCRVVKARGGKKGLEFEMDIKLDTQTSIRLSQVITT